jgi:hypothetical protein
VHPHQPTTRTTTKRLQQASKGADVRNARRHPAHACIAAASASGVTHDCGSSFPDEKEKRPHPHLLNRVAGAFSRLVLASLPTPNTTPPPRGHVARGGGASSCHSFLARRKARSWRSRHFMRRKVLFKGTTSAPFEDICLFGANWVWGVEWETSKWISCGISEVNSP